MGRIDPKIVVKGEESPIKIVKLKGKTSAESGHQHDFVIYDDDTVEIFEVITKNTATGKPERHTHEYLGEYPYGVMSKVARSSADKNTVHFHKIDSVSYPIDLQKKIYGKVSFKDKIDKKFSEFGSQTENISMDEFFQHYQNLFYEIPKDGNNSHKSIILQSTEYVGGIIDSRDTEIISLTNQVVDLERKLAEAEEADKEHPVFTNGTFLKEADKATVYYMDKGAKRPIADYDTYLVLKRVNGHELDKPDEEVYILVNEDVIKGLDTGPRFTSEDLYGDEEQRDKEEEKKRVELDPDDFIADPSHYNTTSDYIEALDRETRQLLAKEEYVQELYYRYKADSENITDSEERGEASSKFQEIRQELYHLRRKILRYTDILESVDPDGDLQNIEIDTSQLKQIVEQKMSRPDNEFTQAELQQLRSRENKIERFLDSQGRATYGGSTRSTSGGSGTSTPSSDSGAMSGYLASAGITGVDAATEEQPKNPPAGYVSNGNRTVKNHTAEEAIRAMKLGARSPGGNYYWTLKPRNQNTEETPKLINPQWTIYEQNRAKPIPINGGTYAAQQQKINIYAEKPVSKYWWSTNKFEWFPVPGKFPGVRARKWEGKTIHKL
tara:strand:+ start:102 stop:1931 length:1830 start_codon:yes stop_codon:yes gene_type:complete